MAEKSRAVSGAATAKGKPAQMTKMGAVRQALAKLGKDARPIEIRDFVKSTFGIEMSADHASTCKGEILRQQGVKAKAAPSKAATAKPATAVVKAPASVPAKAAKPPAKPIVAKKPAAVTKVVSAMGNGTGIEAGISLQDILAVKELVKRVGDSPLKKLIEAFAR